MAIEQSLISVSEKRAAWAALKKEFDGNKAAFDLHNSDLVTRMFTASEALCAAEDTVRGQALDIFEATQNKKPCAGVEIKIFTGIKIKYISDKALAWAIDKGLCLSLDKARFEKVAPLLGLDFVSVEEKSEPRAQISSKL
jgi:hypothetical protein